MFYGCLLSFFQTFLPHCGFSLFSSYLSPFLLCLFLLSAASPLPTTTTLLLGICIVCLLFHCSLSPFAYSFSLLILLLPNFLPILSLIVASMNTTHTGLAKDHWYRSGSKTRNLNYNFTILHNIDLCMCKD